jgi:hypothetical protein
MNNASAQTTWGFISGLLVALMVSAQPAAARENENLSREKWASDLRFLERELPHRHKNAFHTVPRPAFEQGCAQLEREIPKLPESEIIVRIQQLVASIGDSHTSLATFPPKTFRRIPLTFSWFGPDLRVTRTVAAYKEVLGARLVQVGDCDVKEVMIRVDKLVPHENDYWVRAIAPGYLPYAETLRSLKILSELEQGQWVFETIQGKAVSLQIKSLNAQEQPEWISTWQTPPLYRQRQTEPLWCSYLSNSATLYINFRSYPETSEFKRRAKVIFEQMDALKPKQVVIDLRYNTGGDFNKGRAILLSGLRARKAVLPPGALYVIIGKATQSAAMVNAIDFRKDAGAMLVGEPTGGRPNGYSEAGRFRLPNSNLEISCSTRFYKFQDRDSEAVMPDKLIEPDWQTYAEGRDPVTEWIIRRSSAK